MGVLSTANCQRCSAGIYSSDPEQRRSQARAPASIGEKTTLAALRRLLNGVLLAALLLFLLTRVRGKSPLPLTLADLDELELAGHQRLLVLAPHCDDETLSSAGLIMQALRAGVAVRTVIATNGDGSIFATMAEFRRVFPTHRDYIRVGITRQQESLDALRLLGLGPEQVIFLGYPDRGLSTLWQEHWSRSTPYRSPYNGAPRSPYPLTYNPQAVYAGKDLLADLEAILRAYQPDLIIYPHPNDVHPDHWGLSLFARLALARVQHEDPNYRPEAYAYLVHRPDFPVPKGLQPGQVLMPPAAMLRANPNWLRLSLSPQEVNRKWEAIQAYRSQFPLMGGLLERFVRQNELFARLEMPVLPRLATSASLDVTTWEDLEGEAVEPIQRDPVGDFIVRQAIAASDLLALYAGLNPDGSLMVCAQVRGKAEPSLSYILWNTLVRAETIEHRVARWGRGRGNSRRAMASGCVVCDHVSGEELADAWLLVIGVEVRGAQMATLDRTAYQFVWVGP